MTQQGIPARPKARGRFSGRFQTREGMTAAENAGRLTVGRDQGKAQSERPKRDPRGAPASQVAVNLFGRCSHGGVQSGSPAPASRIAQDMGTNLGKLPGLVVLCPDNNPHHPAEIEQR